MAQFIKIVNIFLICALSFQLPLTALQAERMKYDKLTQSFEYHGFDNQNRHYYNYIIWRGGVLKLRPLFIYALKSAPAAY